MVFGLEHEVVSEQRIRNLVVEVTPPERVHVLFDLPLRVSVVLFQCLLFLDQKAGVDCDVACQQGV